MTIHFHKYQGTGNDFVIIDNRELFFPKNDTTLIKTLCDRKFGIGADGLILLENNASLDFTMVYYNADGRPSSMCGNGGRCITAFAKALTLINDDTLFEAIDGPHSAFIQDGKVHLKMQDVLTIRRGDDYTFLDTGSPHHIVLADILENVNVKKEGGKIRYGDLYGKAGSNVNFVKQQRDDTFDVRTYERGVEDETLSCGTGVTAVALAMHNTGKTEQTHVYIHTLGGELEVTFKYTDGIYHDIYLIGPAEFVFKGSWLW